MSTVTQRSARAMRPGGPAADSSSGAGLRWAALVAVLLLVSLLGAWVAGWFGSRVDPRVAEILDLQRQARETFAANGGPRTAVEATAAVAAMGQIRERIAALPEHLRPQAERSGESVFRTAMQARMEAYFSLPPEQRTAELDRQIDQEELMRKAFAAATAVTAAFRGPGGDAQAGGQQAGSGAAGQAGGAPGGPGGPGSRTEEERNRWRKSNILDRTSPEQRAEYTEYRRAMDARREKRGLPPGRPR
jgi:hypothetical protein